MSVWLAYDEFRQRFMPPPSRDTVESWVRHGSVEKWQPGGPRGKIYYRPRDESIPETEQALLEALNAAQAENPRKRRIRA